MNKVICILLTLCLFVCCHSKINAQADTRTLSFPKVESKPTRIPDKKKVWVFILAGQSNMAGRGLVEPQDTIPSSRILTINKQGKIILAKEPLHFYEPTLTGLDCGLSFGKALLGHVPDNVSILLIPTAVGGSSISQWLGDSTFRNVKLFTNFKAKAEIAKQYGQLKGILWHQGESDANPKNIPEYSNRLTKLFTEFRKIAGKKTLPIMLGELGSYSNTKENWMLINEQMKRYASIDRHAIVVTTGDLIHKGDQIHFNSEGQRLLGQRYAEAYLKIKK